MRDNTIWSFETARFAVVCRAEPEDLDPADSFEFEDDIEFARSGDPAAWFCAVVEVREKESGAVIGRDVLGGCSYRSFADFTESHWDSPADGRNTFAVKARNTVIGHYFPDMVRVAIDEARATIGRLCRA
jgi:hypothetical protein